MNEPQYKKVVLAYSGGLDTSVIVPWLIETYGVEVICFTADLGQGEELDGLEAKAKASGASTSPAENPATTVNLSHFEVRSGEYNMMERPPNFAVCNPCHPQPADRRRRPVP